MTHRWFWRRRTGRRGQIATYLTLITGLILMMTMVTVNVGKVAMKRLQTANAADAGALAGASWAASTDNEASDISQMMTDIWHLWQVLLFATMPHNGGLPLTMQAFFTIDAIVKISQRIMFLQAKAVVEQGYDFTRFNATYNAFANAGVDDPTDNFRDFLERMGDQTRNGHPPDDTEVFTWDRIPSDPDRGFNYLRVHRSMPDLAAVEAYGALWAGVWWPMCIYVCCYNGPAFETQFQGGSNNAGWLRWLARAVPFPILTYTTTDYEVCFPIPSQIWAVASVDVANASDTLQVTVTHCEQGANLRLWQFVYQDPAQPSVCPQGSGLANQGIMSVGRARYDGGQVVGAPHGNPRDSYKAKLVEAR